MRAIVAGVLVVASACARTPQTASQRDRQRLEVEAAKRHIAEYLRVRNDSGLARLMTTDAILDLPAGDVLWSPGAILQQFGYMRRINIEDVRFDPSVSIVCNGGAFEAGEYSARIRSADTVEVHRGAYRLQWRETADGSLRVNRIGLTNSVRAAKHGRACGATSADE